MNPATAYLTFTLARAEQLAREAGVDLGTWPRRAGTDRARRELAKRVSGMHSTRDLALAYARAEGPAFILCPDGEVLRIERARDAGLDVAATAEEAAFAERLRRMTFREATGPAGARG